MEDVGVWKGSRESGSLRVERVFSLSPISARYSQREGENEDKTGWAYAKRKGGI